MNVDSLYHLLPTRKSLRLLLFVFVLTGGLFSLSPQALAQPEISSQTPQPSEQRPSIIIENWVEWFFKEPDAAGPRNGANPEELNIPESLQRLLQQSTSSVATSSQQKEPREKP